MREESQLDEMRAAIRGDFERLARRRGDQELMRVAADEELAVSEPDPEPDPEPASQPVELEPPSPVAAREGGEVDEAVERERSWLDRMLGRA